MGAKPGRGVLGEDIRRGQFQMKGAFLSGFTDMFKKLPQYFDYYIWIVLL
jgi:hypothetical protein